MLKKKIIPDKVKKNNINIDKEIVIHDHTKNV